MEHVVFFPAPDGSPAFRRVATLEAAVRFVEHLRNAEGITEVSMHALTEVPLAFRAWYSVEVPGGESPAETVAPSGPAAAAPAALSVVPDPPAVPGEQAVVEQPVEQAAQQSVEQVVEQPAEQVRQQPADSTAQTAPAAEAAEAAEPAVLAAPVLVAVQAEAPAAETAAELPIAEVAEPAPLTSLGFFA